MPTPTVPRSASFTSSSPGKTEQAQETTKGTTKTGRSNQPHIAIVGAGITGATLSIALTRRGIPHAVYEQSPRPAELGAGLGFGPNAARAMRIIDHALWETFMRVSTPRDARAPRKGVSISRRGEGIESIGSEREGEGKPVWIEFLDGTADAEGHKLEPVFQVPARYGDGHGAVHRARWLEVLMGMVPEGVVQFGKRLAGIEQLEDKVLLKFEDGTTAEAGAVVGCDGVKSKVREVMVGGRDKEGAKCGYSGKYAYRCMIPMQKAVEEIGSERAGVSSLHVLTFPVGAPGPDQLLNLVAFVTDLNQSWTSQDTRSFTIPATREDAIGDFKQGGFGTTVQKLLRLTKDKMDKWGLFDLADSPLSSFYSGRILVIGDAAHASTPHHGSGAGFCMEDVAVLASLLDDQYREPGFSSAAEGLEDVFSAFDASRRERDQWLVLSSRRAADLYEWRLPNTGKEHFENMRQDIERRQAICWGADLDEMVMKARANLRSRRKRATKG
ncbi:hypothetical protein P885DRAFT_47857 [Corynascus similis CBS 632.67]